MGAFNALVNRFEDRFPTQEERDSFAERLKADFNNPNYHLYFDSYGFEGNWLTSIRYTIIGRKPAVEINPEDHKMANT
jgi:hypothetical protein